MVREFPVVCLLPTGSATETVKGISHLFEHFFIAKLLSRQNRHTGYTTEDYVILFCLGIPSSKMAAELQRMTIEEEELEYHKRMLIKEIQRESVNEEEAFFRFVWQDTAFGYEKSPLGTVEEVNAISRDMLEAVRQEIMKKQLFFYSFPAGLETINLSSEVNINPNRIHGAEPGRVTCRRNKIYQGNGAAGCYSIFYFNRCIEAFYLLERILRELNPGKHIQLSEKKRMSALIVEADADFPTRRNIGFLREKALDTLNRDLDDIRANINERALNELESAYFHGKSWQQRITELNKITDRQLLKMVGKLK